MRGYFDEEEEPERLRRDTELILGPSALLAMLFGLVLICGFFFGLGYVVGYRASGPAAATVRPGTQTAAPDQEPLQGNSSIPKPSAAMHAAVPPSDSAQNPATNAGANPVVAQQVPAPAGQTGAAGETAQVQVQTQVRSALPSAASPPQTAAAPSVHPALPEVPLMVQIAAVSHNEDAEVLVNALRRRGYQVTASRELADGLIHVRIGPFNSRDEANHMCLKLLNDGYNAIIQP